MRRLVSNLQFRPLARLLPPQGRFSPCIHAVRHRRADKRHTGSRSRKWTQHTAKPAI